MVGKQQYWNRLRMTTKMDGISLLKVMIKFRFCAFEFGHHSSQTFHNFDIVKQTPGKGTKVKIHGEYAWSSSGTS